MLANSSSLNNGKSISVEFIFLGGGGVGVTLEGGGGVPLERSSPTTWEVSRPNPRTFKNDI